MSLVAVDSRAGLNEPVVPGPAQPPVSAVPSWPRAGWNAPIAVDGAGTGPAPPTRPRLGAGSRLYNLANDGMQPSQTGPGHSSTPGQPAGVQPRTVYAGKCLDPAALLSLVGGAWNDVGHGRHLRDLELPGRPSEQVAALLARRGGGEVDDDATAVIGAEAGGRLDAALARDLPGDERARCTARALDLRHLPTRRRHPGEVVQRTRCRSRVQYLKLVESR